MVRQRSDTRTMDLLTWEPPELVERYEPERVRSASLRDQISRAVAETLNNCDMPRSEIAERMAGWLGESMSEHMLNNYASQGQEQHTIPYLRLLALVHVTGDTRLLQMGAELFNHSVVDDRYLPWVEVGQLADHKESIDKAFEAARRNARKGAR